jgi:hypothetical protein
MSFGIAEQTLKNGEPVPRAMAARFRILLFSWTASGPETVRCSHALGEGRFESDREGSRGELKASGGEFQRLLSRLPASDPV